MPKLLISVENRLTATVEIPELSTQRILKAFFAELDIQYNEGTPEPEPPEQKRTYPTNSDRPLKVIAVNCPECDTVFSAYNPLGYKIGDLVSHRPCGSDVTIESIDSTTGTCPKCGKSFYNIGMVNGTTLYKCQDCKSPIDLVRKADGTCTGAHDLKY